MKITAKLFATLRRHTPTGTVGNAFEQEAEDASTVGELIEAWGVPDDVPLIIFVNSRHAEKEQILHEGDVLAVFPPIAGG